LLLSGKENFLALYESRKKKKIYFHSPWTFAIFHHEKLTFFFVKVSLPLLLQINIAIKVIKEEIEKVMA
jgi:hypothetical protein